MDVRQSPKTTITGILSLSNRLKAVYLAVVISTSLLSTLSLLHLFRNLPENWLGCMDGYFYGMLIKTNLHQVTMSGLDPNYPVQYPPYYFMLMGAIGRICGIADLGLLQAIGFAGTFLLWPILVFFLLRVVAGSVPAMVFSCTILTVMTISFGWGHVIAKPHELIALSGIFAILIEIVHWQHGVAPWQRIAAGLLFGFCLGAYTPFFMVPFLVFCGAVAWKVIRRQPLFRAVDFAWWIPAILAALPYALELLDGVLRYGKGPTVTFFTEDNYTFFYFRPFWSNAFYLLGAPLAVLGGWIGWSRRDGRLLWLAAIIAASFLAHAGLILARQFDVFVTMPFKYVFPIPFFVSALLVLLLFEVGNPVPTGWRKWLAVGACVVGIATSFVPARCLKCTQEFSFSMAASPARNKVLDPFLRELDEHWRPGDEKLYYIGMGELQFVDYAYHRQFVNFLPFNHSYCSAHVPFHQRRERLQAAARSGPDALFHYLAESSVGYLLLALPDPEGVYRLSLTQNLPPEMHIPCPVDIPCAVVNEMVLNGQLTELWKNDVGRILRVCR